MTRTLALILALILSACSSHGTKSDAGGGAANVPAEKGSAGAAKGIGKLRSGKSGIQEAVVQFGFDSDAVTGAGLDTLRRWADWLVRNPKAQLRLEGHTDERGTRDYNVSLGERRANAVRKILLASGAAAKQIAVVSFGEERPVNPDHDEAAWAQNRRVEILD